MSALPLFDQATGEQLTAEDAIRYTVVAFGYPDAPGALLFSSDDVFYEWGQKSLYAKELTKDRQRLDQLRGLDEGARLEHLAHRMDIQRRVQSHLESLSESIGLPIGSEELLLEALQKSEIRQLTTDPITLYRGQGFTGESYTLWGDHPDFNAINFNNATSSVKLFLSPFGTLFQRPWYRGRRFVMFGVPYLFVERLSDVGFDNTASSYMQVAVLF